MTDSRLRSRALRVGNPAIFISYLLCHLQWELATDHGFLNRGTMSRFVWAGFLILVRVSTVGYFFVLMLLVT